MALGALCGPLWNLRGPGKGLGGHLWIPACGGDLRRFACLTPFWRGKWKGEGEANGQASQKMQRCPLPTEDLRRGESRQAARRLADHTKRHVEVAADLRRVRAAYAQTLSILSGAKEGRSQIAR